MGAPTCNAGASRDLACILVFTRSKGWNISVEATALSAPLEKATKAPWPGFPGVFLEDILG